MRTPFSVEQFFDVFRSYNETVWPSQWILAGLALLALLASFRTTPAASRVVSGVLALLWLWMGVIYHFWFFQAINPAATIFGAAFVAQAALFVWFGFRRRGLEFRVGSDGSTVAGWILVFYALVVYPALGYLAGHRYPASPTFGLPCPTTIFTFGLLVWARSTVPRTLLVIPVLWSLIGTLAALQLGVPQDFGLIAAATTAVFAVGRARRQVLRLA